MQNVSKVNLSFKKEFAVLLAVITLFRWGVRGWKSEKPLQSKKQIRFHFLYSCVRQKNSISLLNVCVSCSQSEPPGDGCLRK